MGRMEYRGAPGHGLPATIRLATEDDAGEIADIYAPVVRATIISFEFGPPSADQMRRRIGSTLERFPWLVYERDGRVSGYAYAAEHGSRAAYQWSADVSAYVREDERRSGVGRALYKSLFAALVLLGTSTLLLYSMWILTVSAAFFVVKVDNLTYFFQSIFDAARWPSSIFKGPLAFVFTFIVPLALMTTFPAEAMLGRLPIRALVAAVVGSVVFAFIARRVWLRSIGHYTSASS